MSQSSLATKSLGSQSLGSRAVTRRIEAGSMVLCTHCQEQVKFAAKQTKFQVIANVYVDGRWDRVEHFHQECYELAAEPWGSSSD
ncbi:MAG: hypothetical protein JF603_11500 [Acidobacteria bacterium]|nr:hypothetical protein [Acidobacteriota bacterium]